MATEETAARAVCNLEEVWRSRDESQPMSQRGIDINLGALELAEERGGWYTVARFLSSPNFAWIEKFADAELHARLDGVRERLAAAQEYERIHGEGSLLVKDHPFNIRSAQIIERARKRWPPPELRKVQTPRS